MRILLYGYYNNSNLGDDIFKFVIENHLKSINIEFITVNPDLLRKYTNDPNFNIDLILIGGGEIVNEFFLLPLFDTIKKYDLYKIPIYGVSIGGDNIKYIDFFDKCIFRNKLSIIDDKNYYFDNDIVFGLNKYYNIGDTKVIPNTIGYYLINNMSDDTFNNIKEFTNKIKDKYTINFILFDRLKDTIIVDKLILECDLLNYNIINNDNNLELIKEINKNEKHLCLRFHAHVLCYIYKLQFISFPLTNKTVNFNKLYQIESSLDVDEMLYYLDNQKINFSDITFDYNNFDSLLNTIEITCDKKKSIWFIYSEIYNNFLLIFNNTQSIKDINEKINYLVDQIELNILTNINTDYRYGLMAKILNLITIHKCISMELRSDFIRILTDITLDN